VFRRVEALGVDIVVNIREPEAAVLGYDVFRPEPHGCQPYLQDATRKYCFAVPLMDEFIRRQEPPEGVRLQTSLE